MRTEDEIRALVTRLSRRHPSGGTVIERAEPPAGWARRGTDTTSNKPRKRKDAARSPETSPSRALSDCRCDAIRLASCFVARKRGAIRPSSALFVFRMLSNALDLPTSPSRALSDCRCDAIRLSSCFVARKRGAIRPSSALLVFRMLSNAPFEPSSPLNGETATARTEVMRGSSGS